VDTSAEVTIVQLDTTFVRKSLMFAIHVSTPPILSFVPAPVIIFGKTPKIAKLLSEFALVWFGWNPVYCRYWLSSFADTMGNYR